MRSATPAAYPDGRSSQPSLRVHARIDVEPPRGNTSLSRPPLTGSMRKRKNKHAVPGRVHHCRFALSMPQTHRVQHVFSKASGAPATQFPMPNHAVVWQVSPRTLNRCLKHLTLRCYYVSDVRRARTLPEGFLRGYTCSTLALS